MSDDLQILEAGLLRQISDASSLAALEQVRVAALGKRGQVSLLLQSIKEVSDTEKRKQFGRQINRLKSLLGEAIAARKEELNARVLSARLQSEQADLSLPPRAREHGALHPIRQVTNEIIAILGTMGFACVEGPEIEDDFHNFTALNIPEDHPARQMQDTFYVDSSADSNTDSAAPRVLRTHTSPVQVRTMLSQAPPIRVMAAGRTYRCDSDITHTPMFHQMEGLVIDESSHFGHLKGCLYDFCRAYFELDDVSLRFRPSYFPFTEPSAEVDIGCERKDGELRLGSGGEWMEILGCGMVHPNVLRNCGIDAEKYQGFAFGMGIERLAMLKYGMSDLRDFFEGDVRWLWHYGFSPLFMPSLVRGLNL